jgi:hypothetical protein
MLKNARNRLILKRAGGEARTPDLLITNYLKINGFAQSFCSLLETIRRGLVAIGRQKPSAANEAKVV